MTSLVRATTAGVVLTVAASTAFVSPGIADPRRGERSLRQAVTVAGITDHQAALQRIANANKFLGIPTRATGTPGHERSVHYVVRTLRAAGLEVSLQPFLVDIFDERSPAVF